MLIKAIDIAPHVRLLVFPFPFPFPLTIPLHRCVQLSLPLDMSFMLSLLLLLLLLSLLGHVLLDGQPRWIVKRRRPVVKARHWSRACRLWMTWRARRVTK
jgi:hypothetical protein